MHNSNDELLKAGVVADEGNCGCEQAHAATKEDS